MSATVARRAFVYTPPHVGATLTVCPSAAAIRSAVAGDVEAIRALIEDHAAEGRLLHRAETEIAAHIGRFVVATVSGRVVGCADLAPLGEAVAEVRSLVVSRSARSNGIGRRLLAAVLGRARRAGFTRVAAFTHSPAFFIQAGFSIVPPAWLPEKIARDCHACEQFRRCGQYSVMLSLPAAPQPFLSHGAVHG